MNQQVVQERKVEQMVQALRVVLIVAGILLVVGGLRVWMKSRDATQGEKAFSLLFQAEQMEQTASREAETQKVDLFTVMGTWPGEKKKEYEDKLNAVVREYPKSAASALASLRLARYQFGAKKFAEARATYQKMMEQANGASLSVYRAMALDGLASTFESENQFDEARKTYEEALKMNNNPLKPLAYLGHARSLKALGKAADAKGSYEKLMQEFPGSPYAQRARVLLYSGI